MRTIYETSTEDFYIADSAEEAIALCRAQHSDMDFEKEYGEPLEAESLNGPNFKFHAETIEDVPEKVRSFAVQQEDGHLLVDAPLEEWAKCESGYLASRNF